MKDGLERLIGKTIVAVVANPKYNQVFLVFSDNTHFEFYVGSGSPSINWARGLDSGGLERLLENLRTSGDEGSAVFK
jgi:hypothetical protein